MIKTKTLTFHSAVNYGAVLQALALQKVLLSMNVENKIIDYTDRCMIDYNPKDFRNLSFKRKIKKIVKNIFFFNKLNKKYNKFKLFTNNNLLMTKTVNNIEDINNVIEDEDILITGSDQVWSSSLDGGLSDIYTLNVGNDSNYRISYAASIGTSVIEDKDKEKYIEKLKIINKISVRERTAQKELSKIIQNKNIDVNIDPTLLLSQDEWNQMINNLNKEHEKYILAYTMDDNSEYVKIVNKLSQETGYKIIYFDLKNKGFKNVYKNVYLSDPFEFINYIKNAEFVVTNSFHGLVFSIIFNKKFWIIPHKTKGSRMTDLLNELHLNERIVTSFEEFKTKNFSKEINYNEVNKLLLNMRNRSKKWLKENLIK